MAPRDSRSRSPRRELATAETQNTDNSSETHGEDVSEASEPVGDEDLCPICHLLLFNPVTTRCNHTLCSTCMAHWADVSMTSQMTILAPSSSPSMFSGADTEARCPMCRTPTTATANTSLSTQLQQRYPKTYQARAAEETSSDDAQSNGAVETLTLCIGNTHALLTSPEDANKHHWTFFVRPSRPDLIAQVEILLHPTFRPSRVFRTQPPYEISRKGWGYFTITAYVVLKQGWSWISDDAEAVPFRRDSARARLPLDWTLDFGGFGGEGSMGRCRLKVRREGEAERRVREEEDAEVDGGWEVEMVQEGSEGEE